MAKAGEQAAEQADLAGAILAVMDTDGDGVVTRIEFGKAMAALHKVHKDPKGNMTVPEKAAEAAKVPAGADGTQQNAQGGQAAAGGRGDEMMAKFMQFDANHDGVLEPNEVPPNVGLMLRNADRNGDHVIDKGELQEYIQSMGDRLKPWTAGVNPNGVPGDGGRRPPRK